MHLRKGTFYLSCYIGTNFYQIPSRELKPKYLWVFLVFARFRVFWIIFFALEANAARMTLILGVCQRTKASTRVKLYRRRSRPLIHSTKHEYKIKSG